MKEAAFKLRNCLPVSLSTGRPGHGRGDLLANLDLNMCRITNIFDGTKLLLTVMTHKICLRLLMEPSDNRLITSLRRLCFTGTVTDRDWQSYEIDKP